MQKLFLCVIPTFHRAIPTFRRSTCRYFFSSIFGSKGHTQAQPNSFECRPRQVLLGNHCLADPFSWIADVEAAKPYLLQEQAHFRVAAQQLAPLQQQLLSELRHHVRAFQVDDPPEADGPYVYHTHFTPHGTQTITRYNAQDPKQQQEVVVCDDLIQRDLEVAQQLTGLELTGSTLSSLKLSRDHRLLAYGVTSYAEQQCCIVKDLHTGNLISQLVLPAVTSFEWSADSAALYYTRPDESGRPCKVYRRSAIMAHLADDLLFHEVDGRHFVTLTRTKDWRFVLINSTSKLSTEVHLLDAHDTQATPICVRPRQPGLEYFVEHNAGHLLLLTNCSQQTQPLQAPQLQPHQHQGDSPQEHQDQHGGMASGGVSLTDDSADTDYSLYSVPVATLGGGQQPNWQLLLPEVPGVATTDMDTFEDVVVLHQLHLGRPKLLLMRLGSSRGGELIASEQHEVELPDWALWLRPGNNACHNSSTFRLYASSPAHPEVALTVNLVTGALHKLHDNPHPEIVSTQPAQHQKQQQQAPGSCCMIPTDCGLVSQRLWATAPDGTAVPFTLLHQRSHVADGTRPLLVEVYGAYRHVLESEFKPHRLPLLQRGWSVALAHVRGGGELGRRWHAAGRQLLKHHSVTDLLAVLQHLVEQQVTSPGLIAGHAASAGALTLAAAINARPTCFSAAVLEAPFVDWVAGTGGTFEDGTPLVGDHLLTQHETDEWGDPWSDPGVADLVCRLCPYTNLQPGVQYPALLLTSGLADSRVPWWMPVKYAAKLRSLQHSKEGCSGAGSSGDADGVKHEGVRRCEVLLQFDEAGSHFSMGLSGGSLQDAALQQAFLCAYTPDTGGA